MSANRASSLRFDEHAVSVVLDAIRARDLMLHTAQHLRVVTISNVGGTPPPRGLLKTQDLEFQYVAGKLGAPISFCCPD
jgi:hypothetical protein